GSAGQRLSQRPSRGRRGQRQVRHPPDRHRDPFQAHAPSQQGDVMPSLAMTVLWFLVIVAAIPLTLWLLKRSGVAHGALGGAPALFKTVSQLSIGQGQRLVAVEVGQGDERQW